MKLPDLHRTTVISMQTLLNTPRYNARPIQDQTILVEAERAAHECAISILEEVHRVLPPHLANLSPSVVFVGLFTGLHRMIAETQNPQLAAVMVKGFASIAQTELAHWQEKKGRAHAHR